MPFKDPEKKKENSKKYYLKNKEKKKQYQKENAEHIKKYREENPFIYKKSDWIFQGMILREGEDWGSIYLFYITCEECEECGIELTHGRKSNSRTLDHDHSNGFIRNVLCRACNVKRG